ncbi:MAG: hypothetical protein AAGF25_10430, partial [Pseudomonadota bacterium]
NGLAPRSISLLRRYEASGNDTAPGDHIAGVANLRVASWQSKDNETIPTFAHQATRAIISISNWYLGFHSRSIAKMTVVEGQVETLKKLKNVLRLRLPILEIYSAHLSLLLRPQGQGSNP